MLLPAPMPFEEAIQAQAVRAVLPTDLRTFWLGFIPADIRRRAFFSAGVASAELLDQWHALVADIVAGRAGRADARLAVKALLDAQGYVPPEGARGTLLDLSSDARANLVIDTNVAQANGAGRFAQDQDPDILDLWPAQELFRAVRTRVPRPWRSKWTAAGGALFEGRMIARKDDPVWTLPLRDGGFNRFGHPWPPYDFNSGMRTRPVPREDAERLGVIEPGEPAPAPERIDLLEQLRAAPRIRSAALRAELASTGLGAFDTQGVFRLNPDLGPA